MNRNGYEIIVGQVEKNGTLLLAKADYSSVKGHSLEP